MRPFALAVCATLVASSAYAQSEAALKEFFEGKTVIVKIDMPASQQGIDLYPDARRPINFDEYSRRVKANGIAIKNGESVMITKTMVSRTARPTAAPITRPNSIYLIILSDTH